MPEPKGIPVSAIRFQGTREARKFDPLPEDGPSVVGTTCFACDQDFRPGDVTTLVAIGPGDDEEARKSAASGGWYSAVALVVHWVCATGEEP